MKALLVARVSHLKQHEEDQLPDLLAYCKSRGHEVVEVVQVHGRSAFHAKHMKPILEAAERLKHDAEVIALWDVDRLSRMDPEEGMDFFMTLRKLGYKVEFGRVPDLPFEMLPFLLKTANEEALVKQDRKLRGNRKRRSSGKLIGSVPWGYERHGDGMRPTETGRTWVPEVFRLLAAGVSGRQVARTLQAAGVPTRDGNAWDGASVLWIAHNASYIGRMKGNPELKYELLIDPSTFAKANDEIKKRAGKRGTVRHEPALCRPICGECYGQEREGCPGGESPMYRSGAPRPSAAFRCTGTGPLRSSCGAKTIRTDVLESAVQEIMTHDGRPHMTSIWVPGIDRSRDREKLQAKSAAEIQAGNLDAGILLAQQAQATPDGETEGRWKLQPDGLTNGQYWTALSLEEQRAELAARWKVVAWSDDVRLFGNWETLQRV